MRTVHFVTAGTEGPRKAFALYTIVDSHTGAKRLVRVLIDFDKLASLASRAIDNDSGEATLHYHAVTAKAQD